MDPSPSPYPSPFTLTCPTGNSCEFSIKINPTQFSEVNHAATMRMFEVGFSALAVILVFVIVAASVLRYFQRW